MYLDDVGVSVAVAACEDSIYGSRDAQSVCDPLWGTKRASDGVHRPEQLTWNTHTYRHTRHIAHTILTCTNLTKYICIYSI